MEPAASRPPVLVRHCLAAVVAASVAVTSAWEIAQHNHSRRSLRDTRLGSAPRCAASVRVRAALRRGDQARRVRSRSRPDGQPAGAADQRSSRRSGLRRRGSRDGRIREVESERSQRDDDPQPAQIGLVVLAITLARAPSFGQDAFGFVEANRAGCHAGFSANSETFMVATLDLRVT